MCIIFSEIKLGKNTFKALHWLAVQCVVCTDPEGCRKGTLILSPGLSTSKEILTFSLLQLNMMLSQPSGSLTATCAWLFIQQLFTDSLCLGAQQCRGLSLGCEVTYSICLLPVLKGRVLREAGSSQPFSTFWLPWLYLLSPFPGLQSASSWWLFSHPSFALWVCLISALQYHAYNLLCLSM